MPILIDDLSVWDISFRWAGYDPRKFYLRYPLEVENNFRTLMKAIISADLGCWSISLEKKHYEPDEKKFSVYYWIDDIYSCMGATYFNKALLKHAIISRYDFMEWCERMNVPLPQFWFPQGWKLEYEIPEGEVKPGHGYRINYWSEEQKEAYFEAHKDDDFDSEQDMSSKKLRFNQEAKVACRMAAQSIWKKDPNRTIASVIRDDVLQTYCGAAHYDEETIREWINTLAPDAIRKHRGRPRKNRDEDI